MRKPTALLSTLALGLLCGGCATPPARTASADRKVADEYVWYTPTGSHIPIRIRKSELDNRENTERDQEAMRDATRRGLHMDRSGD